MDKIVRRSFLRQVLSVLVLFVVLTLVFASLLAFYSRSIQGQYQEKITEYQAKKEIVSKIDASLNNGILDVRSYVALGLPVFANREVQDQLDLKQAIDTFDKQDLSQQDKAFLNKVNQFYKYYFQGKWPIIQKNVKAGKQQDLVQLFQKDGGTTRTDQIISEVNHYRNQLWQNAMDEQAWFIHKNQMNNDYFIGFVLLMMIVATFVAVRIALGMGRPLGRLTEASRKLARGEMVEIRQTKRQDELGLLSRTFIEMAASIQENERKLVEQNEELQAQQEELLSQQEELEFHQEKLESLIKQLKENEKLLERRNSLNTSLANTLDKSTLLKSIIDNVVAIFGVDKGVLVLTESKAAASTGVSEAAKQQFLNHLEDGPAFKAMDDKRIHVSSREAASNERGYHEEPLLVQDLYLPVVSYQEETEKVSALLVLTRYGRPYSESEKEELEGLSHQLTLALDKLHSYELTESARRINQEIIDTIREGIHLVDREGKTLQVNGRWARLLKHTSHEDMASETMCEWLPRLVALVKNGDELKQFFEAIMKGDASEQQSMVYELVREKPIFVQVYYEKIIENGKQQGFVFVHRDITQEYELDRMKSELVNTVSHELRTPLTGVLGFAERLIHKDLPPERQKKYLTMIHGEAKRLTSLINDFLDIQRMESGKQNYEKTEVDLAEVARDVMDQMQDQTTLHRFQLETETDETLAMVDENRIRQVYTNLISNAVKYSPEGGPVTVKLYREEGTLKVDIRDEGLGIPEEAINQLFQKFYRIDQSDHRKIGGTGLGLSICKEIMEAHGGKIEVHSKPGEGSTFTMIFPK